MKQYGIWLWLVGMSFCFPAWAENYWTEHATGWHWYQDPQEITSDSPHIPAPYNPVEIMEAIKNQVKFSLDHAILNPTPDNVRNYITLQNQISAQASRFAQVWRGVLLSYPMMDYSLQHPTNAIGRQIYLDQQQQTENQAITNLA